MIYIEINTIKSLFTLFTGVDDYEQLMPIISLAITEVDNMLVSQNIEEDTRLDFLTASIANFRYQQIVAGRSDFISTFNGDMLKTKSDSGALKYAEKLMLSYIDLCQGLIKEKSFEFFAI